jgi:hypothetical protein
MTQVFAVQLNQIKSAEYGGIVVTPGAQQVEGGETALVDHNGLAVNKAGLRRQAFHRRDNAREAVGEVRAMPGISRTSLLFRRARMRNPSCLISWIQSGPAGGSLAGVGRQGVMVKQGRKAG